MHVISTWNSPSAIYHSCRVGASALVIARAHRVEVVRLTETGLTFIPGCAVDVWGMVTSLKCVSRDDNNAAIFVTTDHPRPMAFILAYRIEASTKSKGSPIHTLTVTQHINLHTRADRIAEFFQGGILDPVTGLAISSAYASSLKVIPTTSDVVIGGKRKSVTEFDARVPEINILSMAFLPPSALPASSLSVAQPLVAILHSTPQDRRQLILRRLDLDEKELASVPSGPSGHGEDSGDHTWAEVLPVPMYVHDGANLVIPVAGAAATDPVNEDVEMEEATQTARQDRDRGGLLVIGTGIAQFFRFSDPPPRPPASPTKSRRDLKGKGREKDAPLDSPSGSRKRARDNSANESSQNGGVLTADLPIKDVTTYDFIDGSRLLLADEWGRVVLLVLQRDSVVVTKLKVILLPGEISPASSLTYLSSGFFYVGSHCADAQLVRLLARPVPISSLGNMLESAAAVNSKMAESEGWPGSETTSLHVVESYKNVAPITDAIVMPVEGSIQVVACSGAFNSGTIRIMRKSADFKELAAIEQVNHVTMMWPLKLQYGDEYDRYLMISTLYSTALVDLSSSDPSSTAPSVPEAITSDQLPALIRSSPTIATGNVRGGNGSAIVQVTAEGVWVIDTIGGFVVSSWPAAGQDKVMVTNAGVNGRQVLVALNGGRVVYLTVGDLHKVGTAIGDGDDELRLMEVHSRSFYADDAQPGSSSPALEISAISINPLWLHTSTTPQSASRGDLDASRIAAIGFWDSNSIQLVSLPGLKPYDVGLAKDEGHRPRSLLLHAFGTIAGPDARESAPNSTPSTRASTPVPTEKPIPADKPLLSAKLVSGSMTAIFLLAGLVNGTLVTYELDPETHLVRSRRALLLGNIPLILTPCRYQPSAGGGSKVDGYQNVVFVGGSRPTIVFLDGKRLQHSPINLKDVSAACTFNSPAYSDGLILSRNENLIIGKIDTLHELQIHTKMYGRENPIKMAHDPVNKMYGVALVKQQPLSTSFVPGEPRTFSLETSSSLRLIDEVTFQQVSDCPINDADEITSVMSYPLRASDGETKQYWVVGSETLADDPRNNTGRLSIYSLLKDKTLELVASIELLGPVSAVEGIDGKVVVAAGAGINVFELTRSTTMPDLRLVSLASWNRGYQINQIRIQHENSLIFTSDALRSIDVLRWAPQKQVKLELYARDHRSQWPVTIGLLGDREVLVAEGQGHIYSYKVRAQHVERAGAYYLGEQITEIRQGSVVAHEGNQDIRPSLVFFTNLGRIGVVSSITQDFGLLLTSLERNLDSFLLGPGDIEHSTWRAPVTHDAFGESAQAGFVDGDFVERFLEYPDADAAGAVLAGKSSAETIKEDYAKVVQKLEQLQLVH
ncbi:hypothetical protein DL93DRAFT_2225425 [Clavulina sp. PMI_390]|nr:hypothetical protein DL93DRAFT_2225425 [Clavulina sp. PMI_390]